MQLFLSPSKGNSQRLRRGAILPLVAVLLPIFILLLGFSVDLAFMQATRAELRTATDVAARAGAIALAESENKRDAKDAAIAMARLNTVANKPLRIRRRDVQVGRSERDANGKWFFVNDAKPWNSVRVVGDRTASSRGGAVSLFFSTFYGGQDFEPTLASTSTFMNVDVCLVLDRSGSMKGQKLKDLQNAVNVFLYELDQTTSDEQVALASYSSNASLDLNLSTDYGPIRKKVGKYKANGFTAIGEALQKGIDGVTGANHRKLSAPIIVLMTDGNHNRGVEPVLPATTAAAQDIVVHTITFGRDADLPRMKAVADETGGTHYHATTGSQLAEVFRTIARTLPTQLTE